METVGSSIQRKEAPNKVTGTAKYNSDFNTSGMLHAKMLTSPHSHAIIKSIDTSEALKAGGVHAVITGDYFPVLCGAILADHPPIAAGKVRYHGEPVAVVVANSEAEAKNAVNLIKVEYEILPSITSPGEALQPNAPLVHENLIQYTHEVNDVYPEPNTNIANRVKIRKGDMNKGWAASEVIAEASFNLPQADHIAMETRNARAEILTDGTVNIYSSSQAPFSIKKQLSEFFYIDEGKVIVNVPLVGGGFGGKASVHLEFVAYLASRAVNGRMVKVANSREEDMVSSPCKIGLEARVKLGATREGKIMAAEIHFLLDGGAYADTGPLMAKAIAADCTGPYNIENVWCDSLCIYTNHPYVTSFRGFGHACSNFCIERTMDKLAADLNMDALELRMKNAITAGHTSPTQVKITQSNAGDLPQCLQKLKTLMDWDDKPQKGLGSHKIRSKGVSCLWKNSDSPTDAHSAVILTFNPDGTINLNCGAVEIGPGMKTTAAQILADRMKMDINQIHVVMEVNTQTSPHHWKTVASMTTFLIGKAVLAAAEDVIEQLRDIAARIMKCSAQDLEVSEGKVYLRDDPSVYLDFAAISHGYKYPNGNAIGSQIIGRGIYSMQHLTPLTPDTGQGKTGPAWTVGAQGVELEYDSEDFTYRLIKAATVLDTGKVINPKTARGLITGGMCMGLGLGSREAFLYSETGEVLTTSLRTYKPMRYGENPEYLVEFVETPQLDAPYGARGIAEHGTIGIPAALANALSNAAGIELNELPITPELIWQLKGGSNLDSI